MLYQIKPILVYHSIFLAKLVRPIPIHEKMNVYANLGASTSFSFSSSFGFVLESIWSSSYSSSPCSSSSSSFSLFSPSESELMSYTSSWHSSILNWILKNFFKFWRTSIDYYVILPSLIWLMLSPFANANSIRAKG